MLLRDIKLIDLNRSEIDKKESRPEKGIYRFKPNGKVYVSWKDPATRPQHYVKWNRNTPRDIERWRSLWNYSEVTAKDPYWPEGIAVNQAGYYVYQTDMILMKCPLADYVQKRKEEIERSELAVSSKRREYEAIIRQKGVAAAEVNIEKRIFGDSK
jgi:hypothetical protein